MRYKINLIQNVKNNYIGLPAESPLRHGLTQNSLTQICSAIKVQSLHTNQIFYMGFTGQQSNDTNTLDISLDLARLLGLE